MKSLGADDLLQAYPMERLKEASIFGALSTEAIDWLIHEGDRCRMEAGESLFEPAQRGDSFYIILEGKIALYNPDGEHFAHIRDYEVGQQVGFVSTIALHDRIGKAVATTSTTTLEINYRVFYQLHRQYPADFGLMVLNMAREMLG